MSGARAAPSELPGSSAGLFTPPPECPVSAAGAPAAPDVHAARARPHAASTATLLALAPPPRPRARLAALTGRRRVPRARPLTRLPVGLLVRGSDPPGTPRWP